MCKGRLLLLVFKKEMHVRGSIDIHANTTTDLVTPAAPAGGARRGKEAAPGGRQLTLSLSVPFEFINFLRESKATPSMQDPEVGH